MTNFESIYSPEKVASQRISRKGAIYYTSDGSAFSPMAFLKEAVMPPDLADLQQATTKAFNYAVLYELDWLTQPKEEK